MRKQPDTAVSWFRAAPHSRNRSPSPHSSKAAIAQGPNIQAEPGLPVSPATRSIFHCGSSCPLRPGTLLWPSFPHFFSNSLNNPLLL